MAQTFKTAISIVSGAASSQAVAARVDGDSQNRINIDAGGKITWGSGSAAGDTTLYRSAADLLKTDDAFEAASLSVAGEFTLPTVDGSSGQVLSTDGTGSVSWTTADHGSLAGLGDDDHTQYPKLTNSDTAPSSPRVNDMWYDTTNGRTYVYYDSFWVEMGSGSGEILLDNISDVNAGAPAAGEVLTYNGTTWENGSSTLFTYQNSGTGSAASSTTSSYALIAGNGFPFTFVVPSTGKVLVIMSLTWRSTAGGGAGGINIRLDESGTTVPGSTNFMGVSKGVNFMERSTYIRLFSGLTPGSSLTWRWEFNNAGSGTVEWWYGGQGLWTTVLVGSL